MRRQSSAPYKNSRWSFLLVFVGLIFAAACAGFYLYQTHISFRRVVSYGPAAYKMFLVKYFPFSEENALKEWEEKVFKGKVVYRIEQDKTISYVRAQSSSASSALYYKIKLDAKSKRPLISWKWAVHRFPEKAYPETLGIENQDDFAARVYVIFPAMFITNSKVIEYIWTENVPLGMTGTSPFSKNIKVMVLRSGLNKEAGWCAEERDVIADYLKLFGKAPEHNIGAVAFMTNAEHTGSSADSSYDEIRLGYREDAKGMLKQEVSS